MGRLAAAHESERPVSDPALRTMTDVERALPRWFVRLALRISQLEPGKAYNLIVIVPDNGSEPLWAVQNASKLENQQTR